MAAPQRCSSKILLRYASIWGVPEIGVPPNHPFQWDFPTINHPFWVPPILGKHHLYTEIWMIWGDRQHQFRRGAETPETTVGRDIG